MSTQKAFISVMVVAFSREKVRTEQTKRDRAKQRTRRRAETVQGEKEERTKGKVIFNGLGVGI